jgi:hypothetical protein
MLGQSIVVHHSKIWRGMAGMGQNPNLPRRSIAVRFTLNKQTPTGGVQYVAKVPNCPVLIFLL